MGSHAPPRGISMLFSRFNIQVLFCVLWLAVVVAGMAAMARYEQAPGKPGVAPQSWPAEAGAAGNLPTLLVFAHPQCPCTRATIGELNRLLVKARGRVAVRVVFFAPENATEDWTRSDLWQSAASIPGVSVEMDRDGKMARQFGVETSGQAVLYDAGGQLLFQGGITAGRGHAGDNEGENAILAKLLTAPGRTDRTAVFGCSLFHANRASAKGAN